MRRISRSARVVAASVGVAGLMVAAGCDWTMYHGNTARNGNFAGSTVVRTMSRAWSAPLDGAVYASPVVVGSTLVVATENNTLYGIDAPSGRITWSNHLAAPVTLAQLSARGAPCGNINPLGITGTPIYDSASKRLFAVAETATATSVVHRLVGIDPTNGRLLMSVSISPPTSTSQNPAAHQQRGALTVANGRVFVPFGGLAGDCGRYRGTVASHRTDGTGTNSYYTVPTTREAGIWTPPGPTITPNGNLLVAAGNGASTTTYDGSDAVIELTPNLQFVRRFFPASWQDDNRFDRDLGSTGPAFVSSGGRDFVVQVGKTPTAYVLNRSNLSLAHSGAVCGAGKGAFGGSAVGGSTVYEPCDDGVRAIAIDASGNPRVLWRANGGDGTNPMGSPVIYQGSVLATNRNNGTLYALNPANGQTTARLAVGTVTRFATPALDTNRAYVGTTSGVVAVALG